MVEERPDMTTTTYWMARPVRLDADSHMVGAFRLGGRSWSASITIDGADLVLRIVPDRRTSDHGSDPEATRLSRPTGSRQTPVGELVIPGVGRTRFVATSKLPEDVALDADVARHAFLEISIDVVPS